MQWNWGCESIEESFIHWPLGKTPNYPQKMFWWVLIENPINACGAEKRLKNLIWFFCSSSSLMFCFCLVPRNVWTLVIEFNERAHPSLHTPNNYIMHCLMSPSILR